jgi:succinyl-CoA synthetase beta subunit
MIVSEERAKQLLAGYGLPTPAGRVACTPDEAVTIAQESGGPGVVKALIPVGGRGKASGVIVCSTSEGVLAAARSLLGHNLLGHPVDRLLVEEVIPFTREI